MTATLGTGPAQRTPPVKSRLRSALWLPLFDDLADPRVVARLSVDAEAAGRDGCFVWDQLYWRAPPVRQVADPWIAFAAMAISLPFDADPLPYATADATWWLPESEPGVPLDTVRGVLRDGPASLRGD